VGTDSAAAYLHISQYVVFYSRHVAYLDLEPPLCGQDRLALLALVKEVHEHVHHARHSLHVSRVHPHAEDAPQRRDEVGLT
jgi:hypothetical protein